MRTAYLTAGLAYGDEGKGATVDFICRTRDVKLIVRYNGGPQAAHNVVDPDGRHHTFSQFGSGSFVPGVRTFLSRFTMVNPLNMMNEAVHLHALGVTDIFDRTIVDEKCLIVTPFQVAVNRILAGNRKNTCGQGIGATRLDHDREGNKVLFAGDLADKATLKTKLRFLQVLSQHRVRHLGIFARKMAPQHFDLLVDPDAVDRIAKLYSKCPMMVVKFKLPSENLVFEGAQGVMLDESHGDIDYNTWTKTTFDNALQILGENDWSDRVTKIGVIRTYMTRHGEGPLRLEDPALDLLPEPHNSDGCYQGKFRRGRFDKKLVDYAIRILGGVDGIALNHIDVQAPLATNFEIEKQAVIIGSGPSAKEREWIL